MKFDSSTLARLSEMAAIAGVPPEAGVEQVVKDAVAEKARWAVSIARLERFDREGGKTYSVEEVFTELRQRVAAKRAALR